MSDKVYRNTALYLADMLQTAQEIRDFCAVIPCFEVMGEATKKLPVQLREAHPDVPWRYMAAFRDKLIHDYFEIDLQFVWAIAQQEIPKLIPQLETIARQCGQDATL